MKSMKKGNCWMHFYGTSTVGERGQIVVPAEARSELGIAAGDKLLLVKHPIHKGLMLFKLEDAREFLDEFAATLTSFENEGMREGEE